MGDTNHFMKPPPDVSLQPKYVFRQVVEILYSRHQNYRAVISTDKEGHFRVHREHWDTPEWELVKIAFWNPDDGGFATITGDLINARKLSMEALASTSDGFDADAPTC